MNLCRGGAILLTSLRGWLKVMPEILLEQKKRKVVAQGGQMWKTEHLKLLPKAGLMVWVSCPITQHPGAVFVYVTSEHGGSAPAWTRGLLAYGNVTDFSREQVPCCQGYYRASSETLLWCFPCLHCTCGAALNTQDHIPHAYLYCTSGATSHVWGCTICIETCALHFVPRHFGWASRVGYAPGKVVSSM